MRPQQHSGATLADMVKDMSLPTRRTENWRWSDLSAALDGEILQAQPVADSVELEEAKNNKEYIHALAVALAADGPSRRSEGTENRGPGGSYAHRQVAEGQKALFIDIIDAQGGLAAHSLGLEIRGGADVTRIIIQRGDGVVLSRNDATLYAGAKYRQFVLAEGARFVRIETEVEFERPGAEAEINGVYLCGPRRHADFTSVIKHSVGGGQTRQLIKGVARQGGRGVFQGKIVVAPHAQKTDARQYHHGMLLEDGAEIFAKPELTIYADDVQCAHGNTAGGLDERALFYMRSRGLPEAEARALLIESFLVEAIPEGLPKEVHEELVGRIRAWLAGVAPLGPPASSPLDRGAASRKPPAGTPAVQEGRKP